MALRVAGLIAGWRRKSTCGRGRQPVPRVVRRRQRAKWLVPLVFAAGLVMPSALALRFQLLPDLQVAAAVVIFVPLLVYGALCYRLERFVASAHRANRELCLECGYNLHGLPVEHVCPECGAAYRIEEVKQKWQAFFESERKYIVR